MTVCTTSTIPEVPLKEKSSSQEQVKTLQPPGLISRRLALWLWKLARRGWKGALNPKDLPPLGSSFRSKYVGELAQPLWEEELRQCGAQASLARLLVRINKFQIGLGAVVGVSHGVLTAVARPLLLRQLIRTVDNLDLKDVILLGVELLLEAIFQLWMKQLLSDEINVKVFGICVSLLSRRIPLVDEEAVSPSKTPGKGETANSSKPGSAPVAETTLIAQDLVRTLENVVMIFNFISGVVQLVCGVVVLLVLVGLPSLIGIGAAALLVLTSARLAKYNKHNDQKGLQVADKRVSSQASSCWHPLHKAECMGRCLL